ncbi:MAG: hypothetical protein O2904_04610 [bacterium]|nr:hypothetical protein [bacterium]
MIAIETSESAENYEVDAAVVDRILNTRTRLAKVIPFVETLQKGLADTVSLAAAGVGIFTRPIARAAGEVMKAGRDIVDEFSEGKGDVNPAFQG